MHASRETLRWAYLASGLLYPVLHGFGPAGALDPWGAWLGIGVLTASVALASLRVAALDKTGDALLLACSGLITAHLFALAALNDLHAFYVTGSVLSGVHPLLVAARLRALIGYGAWVSLLVLATLVYTRQPVTLAYGVPMLAILGLAYVRIRAQIEAARESERQRDALEAAVAARTRELSQANHRLRAEIEERERLEEELLVNQKMEALSRLVGGVAHDYNNFLTAILGYAELLIDELPSGSPARAEAVQIEATAQRAAELTAQLLAFSRRSPLEKVPLDLNAVLVDMKPILQRLLREDVELVLSTDPEASLVCANRSQLEQVIMNLAVNARDAMPGGGKVEIEIRSDDARNRRWTVLCVSDTGLGMDAETRARVFDPFFTTKGPQQGTGLGLSIVYAIVQQAGGTVGVSSEPGRGTRLEIWWPAASESSAGHEVPAVLRPGGEECVLVVDDDPDIRRLVCRMLRTLGYRAEPSESGSDALERVSHERFDLVLTDVVMPRMSGFDLARQLRDSGIEVPVLFMSGQLDHPSLRPNQVPEEARLIAKPFTRSALGAKVRQTLDAPAAQ